MSHDPIFNFAISALQYYLHDSCNSSFPLKATAYVQNFANSRNGQLWNSHNSNFHLNVGIEWFKRPSLQLSWINDCWSDVQFHVPDYHQINHLSEPTLMFEAAEQFVSKMGFATDTPEKLLQYNNLSSRWNVFKPTLP